MANIKQALGSAAAMTITLASLTNGSARQSTEIDNSSNLYLDALVNVKVTTGASSTSATGVTEIFVFGTVNSQRTDNAGGSDAAITPKNAIRLGVMETNANSTTYYGGPWSVAQAFGGVMPSAWGVIVKNSCGSTFSATGGNHAVNYQEVYQTAA